MTILLLLVIYITFISLGLPDPLFGAAWPAIYREYGVNLSLGGVYAVITCIGTVFSSLLTPVVKRRFGTGIVIASSVVLTVIGMAATWLSSNIWYVIFSAIPLGFGGGAIDTTLNNYVAEHYRPIHMNLLHCFWGIGAFLSPMLISFFIDGSAGWRAGYRLIVIMQSIIAAITIAALPLWKKAGARFAELGQHEATPQPVTKAIKLRGLPGAMLCMFLYCSGEVIAGSWGSSYIVNTLGFEKSIGASVISAYYLSIAAGRLLSGILSLKLTTRRIMGLGMCVSAAGLVLMLVPGHPLWAIYASFALLGLGYAPIFPGVIQLTPSRYGAEYSQAAIALEMGSAYVGVVTVVPLFGLLLQNVEFNVFTPALWLLLGIMAASQLYAVKKSPYPPQNSPQETPEQL